MAGISEALVATAVGLMVAIPAVVAFNYFNRRVRALMCKIEWAAHLALAELKAQWSDAPRTTPGAARPDGRATRTGDDETARSRPSTSRPWSTSRWCC